jgi:hypothetical protein
VRITERQPVSTSNTTVCPDKPGKRSRCKRYESSGVVEVRSRRPLGKRRSRCGRIAVTTRRPSLEKSTMLVITSRKKSQNSSSRTSSTSYLEDCRTDVCIIMWVDIYYHTTKRRKGVATVGICGGGTICFSQSRKTAGIRDQHLGLD